MTERDSLVLEFINKYKLCTSEHVYNLYFNQVHPTVCSRRLKYLAEYGYIDRFKFEGNNYIYYVGKKPYTRLIRHDLLITDFVVKLLQEGYEILEFKKSFVLGDIIADAFLTVKRSNKIRNILLEVQLSEHDCISKYRNIKKLAIEHTDWDVLPRLCIVGNVDRVDIPGLKIYYLNLKLEGDLWD